MSNMADWDGVAAHPGGVAHTLAGEVSPLSDEWERLPGMQRLITLDGVIYVHQNPKRRRRPVYAEAGAETALEPEVTGSYAEPSGDWSPEPVAEAAGEPGALAGAGPEPVPAWSDPEPVPAWSDPEPVAAWSDPDPAPQSEPVAVFSDPPAWPAPAPAPVAVPAPVSEAPEKKKRIVRSAVTPPPPGYAIEFGTGRLVPIHSYKGRMSFPTSGW